MRVLVFVCVWGKRAGEERVEATNKEADLKSEKCAKKKTTEAEVKGEEQRFGARSQNNSLFSEI